jgi:hypothetical protein
LGLSLVGRLSLLLLLLVAAETLSSFPSASAEQNGSNTSSSPYTGTRYVATTGSDTNPGTIDKPWRTIQHAADVIEPGLVTYVRGGVYKESVSISHSGLSGNPIAFMAYPGEIAILDGSGSKWAGFIFNRGVAYASIDSFQLRNYRETGVDVRGSNSHLTLSRIDASGAVSGVRMTWGNSGEPPEFGPVHHITIRDTRIHDNSMGGIDCTPGPCNNIVFQRLTIERNGVGTESFGADGIAVERGYPILIEDVVVRNNGGDGIDLNSRDRGPTPGVLVRRCVVAGNHLNGVKLWASGRLENCLIYDMGLTPLTLGKFPNIDLSVVNNIVAYNMVYGRSYSARGWAMDVGYGDESWPPPTNVRLALRNNIFAFNAYKDPDGQTGLYIGPGILLTESNNLYFSREDGEIYMASTDHWYSRADIADKIWTAQTGQGAGDLTTDPLFINMVGADFHLQPSSGAIDRGTSAGAPSDDLERQLRPEGKGYDIGAYEFPAVHLAIRGADGKIYFGGNLAGIWNGWRTISGSSIDSPAISVCRGIVHLAIRQTDNQVIYGRLTLSTNAFSGWAPLGRSTKSSPALASAPDCTVYIAIRGVDDNLYLNILIAQSWRGWVRLPGSTIDAPTLAVAGSNLHIAVRGVDGRTIWHGRLNRTNMTWLGWQSISGLTTASKLGLTAAAPTQIYLAAADSSGIVNVNLWNGAKWVGWRMIPAATTPNGPSVFFHRGKLYVAIRDAKNAVYWCVGSSNLQYWSTWHRLAGLTSSSPALA